MTLRAVAELTTRRVAEVSEPVARPSLSSTRPRTTLGAMYSPPRARVFSAAAMCIAVTARPWPKVMLSRSTWIQSDQWASMPGSWA